MKQQRSLYHDWDTKKRLYFFDVIYNCQLGITLLLDQKINKIK